MIAVLTKYRHIFLVGLQSSIVYRWNFATRATFSLVHLVYVFLLWAAVFQTEDLVGGFTLEQTLTYFVTLLVFQFFISAFNEDYQISEEIRNGLINQFLLKPINYFVYRFTLFLSARVVSGSLALLPILLAAPIFMGSLAMPEASAHLWLGLPALFMSALIQFTIAYIFGLLTFWFLEIQSFVILSMAIEMVLGGQIFPLDLLPATLFRISQFLPYYYQMYFPAAIFTGRLTDPAAIVEGLAIQAFWVMALLGIARLLWARGLRRHTAVGG